MSPQKPAGEPDVAEPFEPKDNGESFFYRHRFLFATIIILIVCVVIYVYFAHRKEAHKVSGGAPRPHREQGLGDPPGTATAGSPNGTGTPSGIDREELARLRNLRRQQKAQESTAAAAVYSADDSTDLAAGEELSDDAQEYESGPSTVGTKNAPHVSFSTPLEAPPSHTSRSAAAQPAAAAAQPAAAAAANRSAAAAAAQHAAANSSGVTAQQLRSMPQPPATWMNTAASQVAARPAADRPPVSQPATERPTTPQAARPAAALAVVSQPVSKAAAAVALATQPAAAATQPAVAATQPAVAASQFAAAASQFASLPAVTSISSFMSQAAPEYYSDEDDGQGDQDDRAAQAMLRARDAREQEDDMDALIGSLSDHA